MTGVALEPRLSQSRTGRPKQRPLVAFDESIRVSTKDSTSFTAGGSCQRTKGLMDFPNFEKPPFSQSPPRLVVIGAGSRGNAFGRAITECTNGLCVGVVEPIALKRQQFGRRYIWGNNRPTRSQEFQDWREFVSWETERRTKAALGQDVPKGCDGVFICVQDHLHKEVIHGCASLDIHIMCEKPLATSLHDCVTIYQSLQPDASSEPTKMFSIGHVLRYSAHSMLLRKLLLEDRVIGDTMMVNHTEPVGWWHFAHSFVRGHWRNESTSAPSLLTKSCHDVDFLLWLLCSPGPNSSEHAHLPSKITSTGSLQYFRKEYKPVAAGDATNCLSCPYEGGCKFSAKSIYTGSRFPGLASGNTEWPVDVIVPEIEDIIRTSGPDAGEKALLAKLSENYDENASIADVSARPWFGRCVYESDNDVLDNQTVTFTFDAIPSADDGGKPLKLGKVATFHMTALTKKVCERYTHISGADGEIYADGTSISVHNFSTGEDATFHPPSEGGGHGGGDGGLAKQFVLAIDQVKNHGIPVKEAQQEYIGCSLEEIVRSHAMVFAAEEARKTQLWLDFPSWWKREVESKLAHPDIAR